MVQRKNLPVESKLAEIDCQQAIQRDGFSGDSTGQECNQYLVEEIVGDSEIFRAVLSSLLAEWGGQGAIIPGEVSEREAEPVYLFEHKESFSPLCNTIRSSSGGSAICWQCDLRAANLAKIEKRHQIYICDGGLVDVAMPIFVNDRFVGTLLCGQRRVFDVEEASEGEKAILALEEKLGQKDHKLHKLWQEIPQVSPDDLTHLVCNMQRVANYIAKLGSERIRLLTQLETAQGLHQVVRRLTELESIQNFWSSLNEVLADICIIIGADCGVVVIPVDEDTLEVSSRARLPDTISGKQFSRLSIPPEGRLDEIEPRAWAFVRPVRKGTLCEAVLQMLEPERAKQLSSIMLVPFPMKTQHGYLIFFGTEQSDRVNTVTFATEKDLLQVIAPQIATAYESFMAYKGRQDYIQDVTHQLVQPLTGIQSHAENLTDSRISKDKKEQIPRNLQAMARICAGFAHNFAWAAQAESGLFSKAKVKFAPLDLQGFLIHCAMDMQAFAEGEELRIHVDTHGMPFISGILVSELHLRAAMHNLLYNAVKYSNRNTVITVELHESHPELCIHVINIGIEIKEEERDLIFKRGYRSKPARERSSIGTGIGLFVAREIAILHDGELFLKSSRRVKKGFENTFVLSLPMIRLP